jgi:hypothetical protein
MNIMVKTSLLLLFLFSSSSVVSTEKNPPSSLLRRGGDDQSSLDHPHPVCGRPTDSCMNEENWEQCRFLVDAFGCQKVVAEESCPLHFSCVDPPTEVVRKSEVNVTIAGRRKNRGCVSLLVYKDPHCKIGPVRKMEFETFTQPGSPCCKSRFLVAPTVPPCSNVTRCSSLSFLRKTQTPTPPCLFLLWRISIATSVAVGRGTRPITSALATATSDGSITGGQAQRTKPILRITALTD